VWAAVQPLLPTKRPDARAAGPGFRTGVLGGSSTCCGRR
jgi:hypothetical protein